MSDMIAVSWLDFQDSAELDKAASSALQLRVENTSEDELFVTAVATYDKGTTRAYEVDVSPGDGALNAGATAVLEIVPETDLKIDFSQLDYAASCTVKVLAWSKENSEHPVFSALSPPVFLKPTQSSEPTNGYTVMDRATLQTKWFSGDFKKHHEEGLVPGLADEAPEQLFDVPTSRIVKSETEQ